MPAIDARRLALLCITAFAWIISIPWVLNVWQSGQIPYEPLIVFFLGLASLIELFTGIVQKHFNPGDAVKGEDSPRFDQSKQAVHGSQMNISGTFSGPVSVGETTRHTGKIIKSAKPFWPRVLRNRKTKSPL